MVKDVIFLVFFLFELFYTIYESAMLCDKLCKKTTCTILYIVTSFFEDFPRMTFIGIVLKILHFIISIPAVVLAFLVVLIIYTLSFLQENLPRVMYKKELDKEES